MRESALKISPLPVRRLANTEARVSVLGFGSAALGNLYRAIADEVACDTLRAALNAGITYVDTAPHYGQGLAEQRISAMADTPFSLSTKVGRVLTPIEAPVRGTIRHGFVDGNPFEPVFDYTYNGVMRSYHDSLARLGGTRINILLAHDLGRMAHGEDAERHMRDFLEGGYRAMTELKSAGAIRAIGLGVNEWQVAEEVLAHVDLDVVLLAGRYTLLEQTALDSFLPLCAARGVSVIAGGPFNSGILAGDVHYNYDVAPPGVVTRVKALQAVCAAHGVPLAAAALQFPMSHPAVACVLAGMASAQEVTANLALWRMSIPAALWSDLKSEGLLRADAPMPAAEVAA